MESQQLFEYLPPRGFASRPGKPLPLRVHPWLHFCHLSPSTTPLFSHSCKRVRKILKIRKFKSLSFQTHAHSFAVSPLFATHTQNTPGVYVPPRNRKSNVLLEVGQLNPAPLNAYSENLAPRSRRPAMAQSVFRAQVVSSTPLLSYTSALFFTLSNLLFRANHLFSSNCALFCKNTRGGGGGIPPEVPPPPHAGATPGFQPCRARRGEPLLLVRLIWALATILGALWPNPFSPPRHPLHVPGLSLN